MDTSLENIYENAIKDARNLMYEQTIKNKAPSWKLTCLAQEVGLKLAEEYNVNKNIVQLTLYLQHLVFSPVTNDKVQQNHPDLSADYVVNNKLLEKWNIPLADRAIIIEAIRHHHKKTVNSNLIIEVIKNAECQKFVTIKGMLIWLHELGLRGYNFEKAKELVLYKMNQKKELLSLDKCIEMGNKNCRDITNMFEDKDKVYKLKELHKLGTKHVTFEEAIMSIGDII